MNASSSTMQVAPAQVDAGSLGLLATLGHLARSFKLEDAPEVVIRQAKLSILDTVGCMVGGLSAGESSNFSRLELQMTCSGKPSTVASTRKLDPDSAARINAYLGDVFELDDLTGGHASIAVVPTALAAAEANGSGGRALVEAVIVGIEVTSRVYAAYYGTMKSYADTGIAPSGIPSTIGAAASAVRLGGLDSTATWCRQLASCRGSRVTANPALAHYYQCTVRGLDAQEKTLFDVQLQAPKGALGDPVTDDEVEAKFVTLCEGFGGAVDLQSYISDIDSLERAPTCDWVVRHISKFTKD